MLLAGEWLRQPSRLWLVAVGAVVAALWWRYWPSRGGAWSRRVLLLSASGLVVAMGLAQWRLAAVESRWESVREQSLVRASHRLGGYLRDAYDEVDRLTLAGSAAAPLAQATAFAQLAEALPTHGPEYAVSIFRPDGSPWAWAGRHRLAPAPLGDSISVRWNKYYLLLEMRRHSEDGRIILASVVVAADQVTAEPERSLAAVFSADSRVGLEVYPPGQAPDDDPDVYHYTEPTTAGPRILFSVKPVPQEQGAAKEWLLGQGRTTVAWLLLLVFLAGLVVLPTPGGRYALILAQLFVLLRAPVGEAFGLGELFSPATFFRPLVGPFSGSVGMMAATATVVTIIGIALWRRRLPRKWIGLLIGVAALIAAPDLYRELGRGITPPREGVSLTLWLTWQFMMVVAASGLLFIAAAMFRGPKDIEGSGWKIRLTLGVVLVLVATVVGTFLWDMGWPPLYIVLWIPPLFLVVMPAPRRATAIAIAVLAGSAAALATWGAVLEGAVNVARRDVLQLGADPDPLTVASLERFADRLAEQSEPASAAELYARWRASDLGIDGYPARLAVWSPEGEVLADLPLDSLSLTTDQVRDAVLRLPPDSARRVDILPLVPGIHYLLLTRTASGAVVSVAVGPPTRLIAKTQLGKALLPDPASPPLYHIAISPPAPNRDPAQLRPLRWKRDRWQVVGEVDLAFGDGVREVRVDVDLRGPVPVFVRGVLIILLNILVVTLLWLVAEWLDGERPRIPDWRRLARSFRVRLAGALALFFILPAVGFATWSFVRLTDEVRSGRDLLTGHLLQDAVAVSAGGTDLRGDWGSGHLEALSSRIGAEFWVYGGGRLGAVSAAILRDLGLARPLVPPRAFVSMALGPATISLVSDDIVGRQQRVGYRVAMAGPQERIVILATRQLGYQTGLEQRLVDLAFLLLLATLGGLAAALVAARWVAGALSLPVADLRRLAIAIGKGLPLPQPQRVPLLEFEPVFGAFERMEEDIRSSRADLEAARQRTATVLATVATGVVGIDGAGRVLIANRRAAEFLGVALEQGDDFATTLAPEWGEVLTLVQPLLAQPDAEDRTAEINVRHRRYSVHCASLGTGIGGAVIAVTDVTDLAQAERVLAWGEMARQVAHEIKNPLTPMRLGVQHMQRVHRDRPEALGEVVADTGDRILAEIDRLDRIARAFSRFASPEDTGAPLVEVDLAEAAAEVVHLYGLTEDGATVELRSERPATGSARRDEVKEVLVNLLENSRQAGAGHIVVSVAPGHLSVSDDGCGMPDHLRARIFEPRFSTTSSGAGLGLAIVKRQVESWGGTIAVESVEGEGTKVTIRLGSGGG
ncbi:MAG: ATP-binding protein [Gemmatimonadetes bacterium]|nr:ATP-binding protein [Gemmatimonadota bacterium]